MVRPPTEARAIVAALSRNVRARRRAAGLTQGALAKRARCALAFISLIERGKANPSLVTMVLIAGALECAVPDLLSEA